MTLVLLGAAFAPIVLADDDAAPSAPASPPMLSEPSNSSYSDRELRSFAVALLEVERIKSSYAPKLEQKLREQAQVKQAASLEMLRALEKQGMSVDKYQEMLANVQSHPELAGKVAEYLKQSRPAQAPDAQGGKNDATPKSGDAGEPTQKVEEL
jgi:single-stranded DNA-specific DHH superfamily exonuclease